MRPKTRDRLVAGASLATLALCFAVLTLRLLYLARVSFTYDEATYVELAAHPWRSSYYPDELFVRHPPLYFLFMAAWTALAGSAELLLRLPSFLFVAGGAALVWDAARLAGGRAAAALTGALLAGSFLLLVYGIQATMYPLAFLFAALAVHAHVAGRPRLEEAALGAFALTHLFGFVFAAAYGWRTPKRRTALLVALSPALLWLAAASMAAVLVRNDPGPGLGPAWQLVRVLAILYDLFIDAPGAIRHLFVLVLALLLLNPVLLEAAWSGPRRRGPHAVAAAVLVCVLFTGPSFLRFGLAIVPAAFALGTTSLGRPQRRGTLLSLVLAAAGLIAAGAYVNSGLDPNAANDVPGLVDWKGVADVAVDADASVVAVSASPPMAYYLETEHGFVPGDPARGPDELVLRNADGRTITVRLALDAARLREAGDEGSLLAVQERAHGTLAALFQAGYEVCDHVRGAILLRAESRGPGCA